MTAIRDGDESAESGTSFPDESSLGELIELEAQIESRVAQAKVEAEHIVADARRRALVSEEDGDESLDQAARALRESIEQESAATISALAERADREVERYRGVSPATRSRLSQWVASRISSEWEAK